MENVLRYTPMHNFGMLLLLKIVKTSLSESIHSGGECVDSAM